MAPIDVLLRPGGLALSGEIRDGIAARCSPEGVAEVGVPILRSARVAGRHVVVRIEVSDLRPVGFVAAASSAEGPGWALLSTNVRLREAIKLPPSAAGIVRWETRRRLAPGTY